MMKWKSCVYFYGANDLSLLGKSVFRTCEGANMNAEELVNNDPFALQNKPELSSVHLSCVL